MKRVWISIAVFTVLGMLSALAYTAVSISNMMTYEVLSYNVQVFDSEGVTFRVMYLITNPSSSNLEVWDQKYEIFVGGSKVSDVTATKRYKLYASNSSVIPLDVRLKWADVQQKLLPLQSQSSTTSVGDLPVLVKGRMAVKLGILKVTGFPVRFTMKLEEFLP